MTRTVAIVGSHSRAIATAPFDDPSIPIWCFNAIAGKAGTWMRRADAVFQMHQPAVYRSPHNREDPFHWEWLQKATIPIYMLERDPMVPASVKYPLDDIAIYLQGKWKLNGDPKKYFSSSVDYAIALAIYSGFDVIQLHGIEMSSNTEYTYQRVGVALWIGIALGIGCHVQQFGGDAIFDRPLYGYSGSLEHDEGDLQERVADLTAKRRIAYDLVARAEQQLDEDWHSQELSKSIAILREARKRHGYMDAARNEAERYLLRLKAEKAAGRPAYIDRNEHETAAYNAKMDCERHDKAMKESAGAVNIALQSWQNSGLPEQLAWLKRFAAEHVEHAENLGRANGILNENLRLMKQADLAITAAGGEKALTAAQMDTEG